MVCQAEGNPGRYFLHFLLCPANPGGVPDDSRLEYRMRGTVTHSGAAGRFFSEAATIQQTAEIPAATAPTILIVVISSSLPVSQPLLDFLQPLLDFLQ